MRGWLQNPVKILYTVHILTQTCTNLLIKDLICKIAMVAESSNYTNY